MQTTVTEGPGDIEVMADDNIVLKCEVEKDPNLELALSWFFNGVKIDFEVSKNRFKKGADNSLTVIMATKKDGGEYMCKAVTTFSEDSATGVVTVLSKLMQILLVFHRN